MFYFYQKNYQKFNVNNYFQVNSMINLILLLFNYQQVRQKVTYFCLKSHSNANKTQLSICFEWLNRINYFMTNKNRNINLIIFLKIYFNWNILSKINFILKLHWNFKFIMILIFRFLLDLKKMQIYLNSIFYKIFNVLFNYKA